MILLDSTLSPVDFMSLVSKGRSLCVNIHDIQNDVYHLKYLTKLVGDKVDRVFAISGRFNIHHPSIQVNFPNIFTLSDHNHDWLGHLKTTYNLNYTTDFLSKNLRCQQLWVDGVLTNFWYQPLEDHWKNFLQEKNITYTINKIVGREGVEFLQTLNPDSIEELFSRDSEKLMNCDTLNHDLTFARVIDALLWYKLVPNQSL